MYLHRGQVCWGVAVKIFFRIGWVAQQCRIYSGRALGCWGVDKMVYGVVVRDWTAAYLARKSASKDWMLEQWVIVVIGMVLYRLFWVVVSGFLVCQRPLFRGRGSQIFLFSESNVLRLVLTWICFIEFSGVDSFFSVPRGGCSGGLFFFLGSPRCVCILGF